MLFIQVERTADVTFHERMVHVCRFVHAQNLLYAAEEDARSDGMILASQGMRAVHRRVVEVATQGLPSLILLGPSGTGKERLAQAYHRHLGRSGLLVAINCATLSRDRMVADLFGAEAGAYTDAKRAMTGAVERADGGTLFLDELGELPADVQPMLLRFLETGEYQRLGATGRPRFADVRLVAATNRDLRRMVRTGTFREDLFFRLALEIVEVPALRERFADVEAYLRSRSLGETSAYDALQPAARELLRGYHWPGNFREVMNLVRRLPSPAAPGSLDEGLIRRALEAGSLAPISPAPFRATSQAVPAEPGMATLGDWLQASAKAFAQSTEREAPTSWGELSTFIEQFLKPLALAHLAGVAEARSLDDVAIAQVADRVQADRGTVTKQLRRYFESRTPPPK
ncbi:MAG TPA: sigma 54-interacting transcriptional regulator [Labilithrix sp.]|nr:sigma 54-interacting transcriptional regulator [Labilithrix sp.]